MWMLNQVKGMEAWSNEDDHDVGNIRSEQRFLNISLDSKWGLTIYDEKRTALGCVLTVQETLLIRAEGLW